MNLVPIRTGSKVTRLRAWSSSSSSDSRAPDYVLVPVSAGGHVIGLMKAFIDLKADGLHPQSPHLRRRPGVPVSPSRRAFSRGAVVARFPSPRTDRRCDPRNPTPPGGNIALRMIRDNGGLFLAVSETAIKRAHRILAEEAGLIVDPASATVVAALGLLSRARKLGPRDRIVMVITGSGLKTLGDDDRPEIDRFPIIVPRRSRGTRCPEPDDSGNVYISTKEVPMAQNFQQMQINLPKIPKKTIQIIVVVFIAAIVLYGMIYQISPDEMGVIQRFGKFVRTTDPGLHAKLPFGIEVADTRSRPKAAQARVQLLGITTPGIRSEFTPFHPTRRGKRSC